VTRNNSASPAFLGATNRTQHTTYTNTRGHACFYGLPSRYVSESNSGPGPEQKTAHLNAIGGSGFPTRKAKTKTDHNTQSHHGAAHEYTDNNATHKDECVCGSRGRWMGQDTKPNRIVGGLEKRATKSEQYTQRVSTEHGESENSNYRKKTTERR
jgi:hypothetical protein